MAKEVAKKGPGVITRRGAIVAGFVSALGAKGIATGMKEREMDAKSGEQERRNGAKSGARLPLVYLPHGGGPWPFVDLGFGDKSELDALATYLRSLHALPTPRPRAILAISAHWEEREPTVMTSARPPMLYDYYGFPPESYRITWPAPGHPEVAGRVRQLLSQAGIANGEDASRGFDHGTFVPLKLAYPGADVPTLQLSLKQGLDPEEHLAIGRALAPLREEGVFLVGSGMSFHNLRTFGSGQAGPVSEAFDRWLRDAATAEPSERDRKLARWSSAPSARAAHPREEHLLPLMVVAGAAGADRGTLAYEGALMGRGSRRTTIRETRSWAILAAVKLKGLGLKNTLTSLERLHGKAGFERVQQAIPSRFREQLVNVLPLEWYPIEISAALHVAIRDTIGGGTWAESQRISKDAAQIELGGVYRLILRAVQYDTVWDRMERMWRQYYDAGEARWVERGHGQALAEFTGVAGFNEGMWGATAGRIEAVLAKTGSRGAAVTVKTASSTQATVEALWLE